MDRKSTVLAVQHFEVVTHIFQCLGFIINTKMSLTQELEFLGMLVNTNTQADCDRNIVLCRSVV